MPAAALANDHVPAPLAVPRWVVKEELARLDDQALLGLVKSLPQASQRRAAACDLLVTPSPGPGPISDLARHLGVSEDEVRRARQAQLAFQPSSLDAPLAGQAATMTLADVLGKEDPRLEHMLGMHAVAAHWGELPARERQILIMDFQDGMTQAQIGQRLLISQMHVSRLRAHALRHLRARLPGAEPLLLPATSARQQPRTA